MDVGSTSGGRPSGGEDACWEHVLRMTGQWVKGPLVNPSLLIAYF